MSTQITLENFQEVYDFTYNRVLSYIICKCRSFEDVNDIIQDTYLEFYKILQKKSPIAFENVTNYIIGIAKKKLFKYYGLLYRFSDFFIDINSENDIEIPSDFNLEENILEKLSSEEILEYLKSKDIKVFKIFYLYYYDELKISKIAEVLNLSESNVKNILYRTIQDIRKNVKIVGDANV